MQTVKILQKKIVKALETGQDPAPLLKELAELRTKNAAEGGAGREAIKEAQLIRGNDAKKVSHLYKRAETGDRKGSPGK